MSVSTFARDVDLGLSSTPKFLSSKYFYDDRGSELFQQIMKMPEYYLTRSEFEIFNTQSKEISAAIGSDEVNVIELGAGDGYKTIELLKGLIVYGTIIRYYPIDISGEAINQLSKNVHLKLPDLEIIPHEGDYFHELEKVNSPDVRELVLFLGANIGNYSTPKAEELLNFIGKAINPKDLLLLGVDRKKNPNLIAKAYNDDNGITREFNLNLLKRINRELGGEFNVNAFDFYSHYDLPQGEVRSYLISKEKQQVFIKALNKAYHFEADEAVYTELSKKYDKEAVENLALNSNFKVNAEFQDSSNYFSVFLLERL